MGSSRGSRKCREQPIRGLLSETSVHCEIDVPISFAYVCADHSVPLWTFQTLASARPRQKKLKNQKAADFRLCKTPLYDIAGTVKASLRRRSELEGLETVDATVVDTLGGLARVHPMFSSLSRFQGQQSQFAFSLAAHHDFRHPRMGA